MIQEDKASGARELRFLEGPVFANVILADEINRTPPKTQAALLEAMQEHQVTIGGKRRVLQEPFFVLATQNPIEQEGTYPLPEAQLDRFMFNVLVDYPEEEEELEIVRRTTTDYSAQVDATLTGAEIQALAQTVRCVPIADHVARYALQLTRSTRREKGPVSSFCRGVCQLGCRSSCNAVSRSRGQSPCDFARTVLCRCGRYSCGCACRSEASHSDKLQCGGRRDYA